MKRRKTREVNIGGVTIGGGSKIAIQSMTNTRTSDVSATLAQITSLYEAGCEIVRVSVNDDDAAHAFSHITKKSPVPVVADIHFDYRLAVKAVNSGAAKIRINTGNIGSDDGINAVCRACRGAGIPIRIGVNSGSLEKDLLLRYGHPCPQALAESALNAVEKLSNFGVDDVVLSVKSSDVLTMIEANKLIAEKCDLPLHLGVTEAGLLEQSAVKSAVGIGALLSEGIGDTIRVSVTGDPVDEIRIAKQILASLGLRGKGINLVSCPTCARTSGNLIEKAKLLQEAFEKTECDADISVALMGCVVNGPGEAREADMGVACGPSGAVFFRGGKVVRAIKEEEIVSTIMDEIRGITANDR